MAGGGQKPVIIKKKKGGHHGGHHGGAWKVAYADFVTAMMAFFLVMWILGLSESSRKAIAGYFREPGIFQFTHGKAQPAKIEVAPTSEHSGDGSGRTSSADGPPVRDVCEGRPSIREAAKIEKLKADLEHRLADLADK